MKGSAKETTISHHIIQALCLQKFYQGLRSTIYKTSTVYLTHP